MELLIFAITNANHGDVSAPDPDRSSKWFLSLLWWRHENLGGEHWGTCEALLQEVAIHNMLITWIVLAILAVLAISDSIGCISLQQRRPFNTHIGYIGLFIFRPPLLQADSEAGESQK